MNKIDQLAFKTQNSIKPSQLKDSTSGLFYRIVLILKYFGLQPLGTKMSFDVNNRPSIHYEFRFNSLRFYISFIAIVTIVGGWFIFLSEVLHFDILPFRIFSGIEVKKVKNTQWSPLTVAQQAVQVLFPIGSCTHLVNLVWTSPRFAKYLNNWTDFEKAVLNIKRQKSCSELFSQSVRFRNIAYIVVSILLTLQVLLTIPLILNQAKNSNALGIRWPTYLFSFWSIFGMLILDFRTALMIRVQTEGFYVVKAQILESKREKLKVEVVQGWRGLIVLVRNQLDQCGRIFGTNLLMDVFTLFNLWCGLAFQSIALAGREGSTKSLASIAPNIFLCFIVYLRMAFKIFLTERMQEEEQEIVKSLRLMDTGHQDFEIRLETNFLIEWMSATPSKININSLFVLNRSLLFNIMGQAVTYLLVLLQFQFIQET